MMKKLLYLLLPLLLATAFSCSEDKTSGNGGALLTVTPDKIEFGTEGGSQLIDLRTDAGSWTLTPNDGAEWCTPERTSGRTSTSFHILQRPTTAPNARQR